MPPDVKQGYLETLYHVMGHRVHDYMLEFIGQIVIAGQSGDWSVRVVDANGCTWTSAPVAVDAEDCAGCPAMEGVETAKVATETHECPYAADGAECPEGCTCTKVEAADGLPLLGVIKTGELAQWLVLRRDGGQGE